MSVDDDNVVMIASRANADNADAGLAGSEGEAVEEGVVGFPVWTHPGRMKQRRSEQRRAIK